MKKKGLLPRSGHVVISLFFLVLFSVPANAQPVMSSLEGISRVQHSIAGQSCPDDYPVDCGDGNCCPLDWVCVADDQCCPVSLPYYCGNRVCARSDADCQEQLECPAQKILGHDNPQLEHLRTFRDGWLSRSFLGIKLIELYYTNADRINAAIDRSPVLRIVATRLLEKIAPMLGNQK